MNSSRSRAPARVAPDPSERQAIALSKFGAVDTLSFRQAVATDVPFLVELRRLSMRPHELASGVDRSDEQSRQRVMQSLEVAQIIEQAGQAVGLLKVLRDGQPWELYQIQLMPACRGMGLGTHIIRSLICEARSRGAGLRLGVLRANPARRLYERLGFVVISEKAHGYEMQLATESLHRAGTFESAAPVQGRR